MSERPSVTADDRFGEHSGHHLMPLTRTRARLFPFWCVDCADYVALTADGIVAKMVHDPCDTCGKDVAHWEVVKLVRCDDCIRAQERLDEFGLAWAELIGAEFESATLKDGTLTCRGKLKESIEYIVLEGVIALPEEDAE